MLEWTQGGDGARLMMLVHHDDAARAFAYGPESKIGTFKHADGRGRGEEVDCHQHEGSLEANL
jgi:hypothetical protein